MGDTAERTPVRAAVITGHHHFDVPAFHTLFRSMPQVDAYVQNMEDFVRSSADVRAFYDAILFYNMHVDTPTGEAPPLGRATKKVLEQLGSTEQGIFVLHHAILAYPQWSLWSELVGITDRRFGYHDGQHIHVAVARSDHPITRGLQGWDQVDETYTMPEPGGGSEPLLSVEHPKSMRTVGWAREYGKARVFCFQPGHDAAAYANPVFRDVVSRGIQWCARRL